MTTPPPPQFQSNYPRQNVALDYIRPPAVYFDTIGTAFEMIKADWGVYAASSFIVLAVAFAAGFAMQIALFPTLLAAGPGGSLTSGFRALQFVVSLGAHFVNCLLLLGLIGIGLKHALGNWPAISDIFVFFKRFPRALGAAAVMLIPAAIYSASAVLLTPQNSKDPMAGLAMLGPLFGIGFILALAFAGPMLLGLTAAVFSDLPIIEAFVQSFRRLGWQAPLLSALFILGYILSCLGGLLCGIGIVLTAPILSNMIALHYTYFFREEAAKFAAVPPNPYPPTV